MRNRFKATLPYLVAGCLALAAGSVRALDEESIGRLVLPRIVAAAPLHASADLQRYVNLVGGVVASQAEGTRAWRFGVLESESVAAFAVPGGSVLVTSGFLRLLASEDELSAVLAHEIAHVTRRHHERAVLRPVEGGTRPSPAQTAGQAQSLARAGAALYAKGLDSAAEFEADEVGVRVMAAAGYDPSAYLSVLERIDALGTGDPRAVLLTATHPPARARIDHLVRAGIEKLPLPAPGLQAVRNARFNRVVKAILPP